MDLKKIGVKLLILILLFINWFIGIFLDIVSFFSVRLLQFISYFSFIVMLVTFYNDNEKKWIVLFNTLFFFGLLYGINFIKDSNEQIQEYLKEKLYS
ncbi:hypothetical protein [uncultured Fusobacterium sp.]|uniref:hypothetical protein n=1 Tax=uncultured Fusobacterium sp. TaxID=159267 RepID=UPI0015A53674|nr:hypothetical protein [uncultured Fusobacterium sp.]